MTQRSWSTAGKQHAATSLCLLLGLFMGGVACRGKTSTRPPIRPIRDMASQAHLLPQAPLLGARTGSGMQPLIRGVVAREDSVQPDAYETGKTKKGYLARIPIAVHEQLIARGEERFNIYCSVCHDRAGSGQGVNPQRGFPGPVDFASDDVRNLSDGQIFEIITQGIRNMPKMGDQVPVVDRWPIVAWVRVLQRSQHAKIADVEPKFLPAILPEEAN
jgi:mono/diheme cytochrome c family protein